MATSNANVVAYGVVGGQGFKQLHMPISHATFPINQGDLVYLDTSAHIIKALDSDAHAASAVGVALQPSVVSSNLDLSTAPAQPAIMVGWDVVANLKTTASETYYHGTVVYLGADAQTITTVVGTNALGAVVLPAGVASVTGAAGVKVGVLVKNKIY